MKRQTRQALLLFPPVVYAFLTAQIFVAHCAEVTAHVQIEHPAKQPKMQMPDHSYVVLWLTPLGGNGPQLPVAQPVSHYRLLQHNKEFSPHLLVVPLGSSVEFPNRDPFFHNVFSWFDGKRFDLGLYESGTSRTVRFDREGISYVFCNIHPEMGAVVIALRTPYFGVADPEGNIAIRDVPPGDYQLMVWAEGGDPNELKQLARRVQVASGQENLGLLHIDTDLQRMRHKNKFGEDYAPADASPY
jgi:hypothetical protein